MCIGLYIKYRLLLSDFNKLRFSGHILEEKIKFHENQSSGSRVVPCGRTDTHDETNSRLRLRLVKTRTG